MNRSRFFDNFTKTYVSGAKKKLYIDSEGLVVHFDIRVGEVSTLKRFSREIGSGLKDVNGKEIFEGDIAESCFGIGFVFINEQGFRFEFDIDSTDLWSIATGCELKHFKIIGNIRENKELLRGEK